MRTLTVRLVGTTPLLLHRVSEHERRSEIAAGFASGQTLAEEARVVMSVDERGKPAVPIEWLWDALRRAAAKVVVDGQQVSFCKIQSTLRLPGGALPLASEESTPLSWRVYRSVQHAAPKSSESIVVVAPQFKEWAVSMEVAVAEEFPNNALLARLLEEAGKCGIGLFHPPKKQFGQFRIQF